jgi:2'-hydroxyisoflavone reductase
MTDLAGTRILVLGGTVFVGRAFVEMVLARGAEVTTFNRGTSGADAPGVTVVRGDRTNADDLAHLATLGHFDMVVDMSPQVPAQVVASTRALKDVVDAYVVVSTLSAVANWGTDAIRPDSPRNPNDPDATEAPDYSEAKSGVEVAAIRELGEKAAIVRPGVIAGPYERVGRLPWWLTYVSEHELIVAPGRPTANYQVIDVRDLAEALLISGQRTAHGDNPGIVHAIAPPGRDTLEDLVSACVDAVGGRHELLWVGDADVVAAGVEPWDGFPQWLPDDPEWLHAHDADDATLVGLGVIARPLSDTVRDTWQWMQAGGTWNTPDTRLSEDQYNVLRALA